jgi:hypothetical protein
MIEVGHRTVHSEIHKPINCMRNIKKFPQQWQELITVTIYKQGDKTDCVNYSGIPMFSIT